MAFILDLKRLHARCSVALAISANAASISLMTSRWDAWTC